MSVMVAVVLDTVAGEPAPRFHPVVWAGRYLERVARLVPAGPAGRAVAAGAGAWSGGAVGAVAAAALVARLSRRAGGPARILVPGVALWPLLSARLLLAEVSTVETALREDLSAGRDRVSRIVSRDTRALTEDEVRAAALESLAENLSDSVVAPLFWYVVAGLPGAALYRYANTADACWGYRTPRWVHGGKVAARVDDVLNLLPARITAVLIFGPDPRLRAEAGSTASPNAGWPMAAMAMRLGVRLSKHGHYQLNPRGDTPTSADVDRALRVARHVVLLATVLAAVADQLSHRPRGGRR